MSMQPLEATKSILVVDDDFSSRELIADALREEKCYYIHEACNGAEALEYFNKNHFYDLVISDLKMPGINGIELLNKIKEIAPSTYVIIITGYPSINTSVSAMKDGAADFLSKPFKIEDLLFKVNLYLKEQSILTEEDLKLKYDHSRISTKIRELSTIGYIYDIIENHNGDNENIFEEIITLAMKVTGGEICSLVLYNEEDNSFYPKIFQGSPPKGYLNTAVIAPWLFPIFHKTVHEKKAFIMNASNDCSDFNSLLCVPLMIRKKVFALITLINKNFTHFYTQKDATYLINLASRASLNIENKLLYESLFNSIINTFKSLVNSIHVRDHYTERHSMAVTDLALRTAVTLNCSSNEIESLRIAATLHDIGKIAIPDKILLKPGCLTNEEYEIIKNHSTIGEDILKSITLFETERKIVRHHHERWDGKGYPDGLSGKDIPFLSRILSVADTFDAMTSNRPYRNALKRNDAIDELKRNSNFQFDALIVEAFISMLNNPEPAS